MQPPASRRVRTPAIALASPAIVQSGPGSLWILPWRGKRARCVRRRLNRRRERVYHTTWTAQTPPTEPTGIVVLALAHEITRTTSMVRCDPDATSLRSPLQQHTPFLRGVSFRCRRGGNSGCRLTPRRRPGGGGRARRADRSLGRGDHGERRAFDKRGEGAEEAYADEPLQLPPAVARRGPRCIGGGECGRDGCGGSRRRGEGRPSYVTSAAGEYTYAELGARLESARERGCAACELIGRPHLSEPVNEPLKWRTTGRDVIGDDWSTKGDLRCGSCSCCCR